ncbi:MAG: hypothetical protein LRY63_09665 [Nitrincola sp.]|nr:hypothetical protein [Nitrincola sp.]
MSKMQAASLPELVNMNNKLKQ